MAEMTVGEVVEQRGGACALMMAVVSLAEKRGRIPVGFWKVALPDEAELIVNGTREPREGIEPWSAMILRGGWPLAQFDAADGVIVANAEDYCLELLSRALADSEAR